MAGRNAESHGNVQGILDAGHLNINGRVAQRNDLGGDPFDLIATIRHAGGRGKKIS